mmetsp:Transcript_20370/g.29251  ORF Transcript_20370/g.29251 Transcript_20370/m.29251 type:complete len:304 (+) Transcript_20370:50-961(+)
MPQIKYDDGLYEQRQKPWRKVLYERQAYPDNYVDSDKFLDQLDMKRDSTPYTFFGVFLSTSVVAQQLTAVCIFIAIHKFVVKHESFMWRLYAFDVFLLIWIYLAHTVLSEKRPSLRKTLKSTLLFLVCLRVVAPALQTLTSSYSDDTIDALVLAFSTLHLVFHDYAYVNGAKETFSGIVSLNAAMFTAVLLASRLQKIENVTAFVVLAVISFSLFPDTARLAKRKSEMLHLLLTFVMWLIATTLLVYLDDTLLVVYQVLVFFVWLVCPLWLSYLCNHHKKKLRGPWDIAEVPDFISIGQSHTD